MRKSHFAFRTFFLMVGLAGAATFLSVSNTHSASSSSSAIYQQLKLFSDVLERVRSAYVDKPDDAQLIEAAINGMLASLDPHSSYFNPEKFRDIQMQTRGEFNGLGIEFMMENGLIKVVAPLDDTPAAKAGIQANDLIIQLDNEPIAGLTLEQAIEKMRGPVNRPIVLTVERKGRDDPFEVKIIRAFIRIQAVKARLEAAGEIAYIKISSFNEKTHANLVKSIGALKKQSGQKLKGYIIDVRNNPGGLLDQAVAVADNLLRKGVIVLVKGRNFEERQRAKA